MSAVTKAIGLAKKLKHRYQDELRARTPVYLSPVRRIEQVRLPKRICAMTFDDEMMELSPEVLPNLYEYDPEEVVAFKVYTCSTGGSADEVAVFLGDDDAAMEYIEQMVGYRLDTLKSNFEDYRPEEMSKIENAKVLTNGYVTALVVGNDTAPAEEVFQKAFA